MTEEHWPAYYAVTVDRPAWRTVVRAIELFRAEDEGAPDHGTATTAHGTAAPPGQTGGGEERASRPAPSPPVPRFAVDLGCGAGRDARELLRNGWRVLAIDREPAAIEALRAAASPTDLPRLETLVADLSDVRVPPADLVNASISLPFIPGPAFDGAVDRALAAVRPGGRFATMLFGDRDESASDPEMSCRSEPWLRERLDAAGFTVEDWSEREEDGETALGEPHHWHILEVVARSARSMGGAGREGSDT